MFKIKTTRPTRSTSNMDLCVQHFRKTVTQRSLFFFGPKFYNLIPIQVRQIPRLKKFKNEIKQYMLSNRCKFYNVMVKKQ